MTGSEDFDIFEELNREEARAREWSATFQDLERKFESLRSELDRFSDQLGEAVHCYDNEDSHPGIPSELFRAQISLALVLMARFWMEGGSHWGAGADLLAKAAGEAQQVAFHRESEFYREEGLEGLRLLQDLIRMRFAERGM